MGGSPFTCHREKSGLVFSNLGFGVPMDYVYCFFWGLGLPSAGQQLTQMAAGSVTTALRVTIPAA